MNIFQKYDVTNAREVAQLIQKLKQKIRKRADRIKDKKEKKRVLQNKTFKEETKQLYRYLGA
jgi:predicted RNA-binding protein with PIN domain